jgi:hypothetical protein
MSGLWSLLSNAKQFLEPFQSERLNFYLVLYLISAYTKNCPKNI